MAARQEYKLVLITSEQTAKKIESDIRALLEETKVRYVFHIQSLSFQFDDSAEEADAQPK